MRLESQINHRDQTYDVVLRISRSEFENLSLTELDKAIVADCNRQHAPISHRLVGLELICRRIEEKKERKKCQLKIN